jgi:XRE family transcriptional regulator, regulator of sulfur utilization
LFNAISVVRYIEQACSIRNNGAFVKSVVQEIEPAIMTRNPSVEPPRVGNTLAELRQLRALSLDELSRLAGVSKSMLSQIERNQANPTVAVVWRLANALGVPLGQLLDGERPALPSITTVAGHATPSLRSPDGKCELRILGPIELAGQFEWYELTVQPGGRLESEAHEPGSREHLTVLGDGSLQVRSGTDVSTLQANETARYVVDVPHSISNPTSAVVHALMVVVHAA